MLPLELRAASCGWWRQRKEICVVNRNIGEELLIMRNRGESICGSNLLALMSNVGRDQELWAQCWYGGVYLIWTIAGNLANWVTWAIISRRFTSNFKRMSEFHSQRNLRRDGSVEFSEDLTKRRVTWTLRHSRKILRRDEWLELLENLTKRPVTWTLRHSRTLSDTLGNLTNFTVGDASQLHSFDQCRNLLRWFRIHR